VDTLALMEPQDEDSSLFGFGIIHFSSSLKPMNNQV